PPSSGAPHALVTFYRSYLTSADTDPVDALISTLRDNGFDAFGAFATSLKAPGVADWLKRHCAERRPAAIVNATAFSAIGDDGTPFDTASCPVFQVALASAIRICSLRILRIELIANESTLRSRGSAHGIGLQRRRRARSVSPLCCRA